MAHRDGRHIDRPAAQAYDNLNPQEYEQAVKWSLDLINHSQTGQALLRAPQRTSKRLAGSRMVSFPMPCGPASSSAWLIFYAGR